MATEVRQKKGIPRMHSSRMCTTHLLTISHSIPCVLEGLPNPPAPRRQTPPDVDPLVIHVTCDACWEARTTHRCKNITLPQTSFAGGKIRQVPKLLNFGASKPGSPRMVFSKYYAGQIFFSNSCGFSILALTSNVRCLRLDI